MSSAGRTGGRAILDMDELTYSVGGAGKQSRAWRAESLRANAG